MGVGSTQRPTAVRWGVAGNIAIAWVLTLPAAGLVGAGVYLAGTRRCAPSSEATPLSLRRPRRPSRVRVRIDLT